MYNKTTYFLLPLLEVNRINISRWLINSYLGNSEKEDLNHRYWIFIELDDKVQIEYPTILVQLEEHKQYINHYNTKDSIVYVLEIPDKYKVDYDNFIIGKYSKFSKEAKDIVLQSLTREVDYYKNVLNPTQEDFLRLYKFLIIEISNKFDDTDLHTKFHNDELYKELVKCGEIISYPFADIEMFEYKGQCKEWLGELDKTSNNFNEICKDTTNKKLEK